MLCPLLRSSSAGASEGESVMITLYGARYRYLADSPMSRGETITFPEPVMLVRWLRDTPKWIRVISLFEQEK